MLASILERFSERYLEPQDPPPHERPEDAWFAYRIERLERRVLWLFRLVLVSLLVSLILDLWGR